jgi:uncharacterized protein (TIGR02246 family)
MRTLAIVIFIALLSSCASSGGGVATATKDQVAAATVEWAAAFNSRNPARITSLYAPDAVFWGTTAKTVSPTPAAISDYFKDAPQRPDARVSLGEQHIRVYGNIAVNTGYYTFSGPGRDGKTSARPARYTFVYANRDGKWLIVDHHSSFVPGP